MVWGVIVVSCAVLILSSSWEGCKVITYLVWLRWEDCKAVTTEKLKSYTPLFEGDEIMIDDRLVTILKVKSV